MIKKQFTYKPFCLLFGLEYHLIQISFIWEKKIVKYSNAVSDGKLSNLFINIR